MDIQAQINKAEAFKTEYNRIDALLELFIYDRPCGTKSAILEKQKLKAGEQYTNIYDELVVDAAKNNWSIWDFDVSDVFDYETFDNDVEIYKTY